jgi:hypothetical protein
VNDYAFQERLRRGELLCYLRENRVQYLVQQVPRERPEVLSGDYDQWSWRDFSQLYGVYSDPVALRREHELFRSRLYRSGSTRSSFIIWSLRTGRSRGVTPDHVFVAPQGQHGSG